MRLYAGALLAALTMTVTACGGSSGSGGDASASSPTASTGAAVPSPSALTLDPRDPLAKKYSTTIFKPAMTLQLPAAWTTAERDETAFQMYLGPNEEYELTFDHTYAKKESVAAAIARLKATTGLAPGPVSAVTMGGRRGQSFVSRSSDPVRFDDSGFHISGGDIEVMAVPMADGTTLTVFVYNGPDNQRPLDPMRELVRRILATVQWR